MLHLALSGHHALRWNIAFDIAEFFLAILEINIFVITSAQLTLHLSVKNAGILVACPRWSLLPMMTAVFPALANTLPQPRTIKWTGDNSHVNNMTLVRS